MPRLQLSQMMVNARIYDNKPHSVGCLADWDWVWLIRHDEEIKSIALKIAELWLPLSCEH